MSNFKQYYNLDNIPSILTPGVNDNKIVYGGKSKQGPKKLATRYSYLGGQRVRLRYPNSTS